MYENLTFPYVTGKDYLDLSETNPALVIIDMQGGFIEEGAAFECEGAREIVPVINRLVHLSRETGAPVVWVQWEGQPPMGGLFSRKFPAAAQRKACWRDSPDFELYDELTPPVEGDLRVVKHTYGAFSQTNLDYMLRNLGVDSIILTGVATDGCCEATAIGAFEHGYPVAMVADANAGASKGGHRLALERIDAYYGRVASSAEVEEELRERARKTPVLAAALERKTR